MVKEPSEAGDFNELGRLLRKALRQAEKLEVAARRASEPALRPAKAADGVLLVECYRCYRRIKRKGWLKALAAHLDKDPRWQRHKRQGPDNVLRLLERSGTKDLLTPTRRGRIVVQLDFADRFDIHSKLLLAFLYEAGPYPRLLKIARLKAREPWIEKYQQLSKALHDGARANKSSTETEALGEVTVPKLTADPDSGASP